MKAAGKRRAAAAAEAKQVAGDDRPGPAPSPVRLTDSDSAFLLIIEQLLARLEEKEAEVELLRQNVQSLQGRLTYFQVRAIDLIVGWEGGQ